VLVAVAWPFAHRQGVTALPSWTSTTYPSLADCQYNASNNEARLYDQRTFTESKTQVIEFVQPYCAIGGRPQRVTVFMLDNSNDGQLGLGQSDCLNPELVHHLNESWMSSWYLFHSGSYMMCHKPAPSKENSMPAWHSQGSIHFLEPTPLHCSYTRDTSSTDGYVYCNINTTLTTEFFDGFVNDTAVPLSSRCTKNCYECLNLGGECVCLGGSTGSTCAACELCTAEQKANSTCACTV